MMPNVVEHLPTASRERFELAYNDKKKPIAFGEPDDIVVGVLQAWLHFLKFKLPKSVLRADAEGVTTDGIFWGETRDAVIAFQTKFNLKVDGLVGHDTLDELHKQLARANPPPPVTRNASVTVVPKNSREYRCPPGTLICKDPDSH
jgi:peptidoglycan hydrolase-like protein with peptidoglycan-binding domain